MESDTTNPATTTDIFGVGNAEITDVLRAVYQRLDALEKHNAVHCEKIAALETEKERLMKALAGAAALALKNPMVLAIIPKDVKRQLEIEVAKVTTNGATPQKSANV